MKISKGMYIRFNGFISKIGHINISKKGNTYVQFKQPNGLLAHTRIENIDKASFNIIDLIEVGDYINGYPVVDILECYDNDTKRKINRIVYIDKAGFEIDNRLTIVGNNDIKDIITKGQFNSCKYVIERDK